MDTLFRPKGLDALDQEIERLVNLLGTMNPVDPDYIKISDSIKVLCEAREKKNDRVLSKEMLLNAGVSLLGILIVLNFEKTGVITSKAFSWLGRKS